MWNPWSQSAFGAVPSSLPTLQSPHAEWEAFAKRLSSFLYSPTATDLLFKALPRDAHEIRHVFATEYDRVWRRGGCYVLAKALQEWIGTGRIWFVDIDDLEFGHAFLEVPTKPPVFIDDTGHAWRKAKGKTGIAWEHRQKLYDEYGRWSGMVARVDLVDSWPNIAAWQDKAAKTLTAALIKKFGPWPK